MTVTGANDQKVDGNVAYTIVAQPAVSSDPKYNQLTPPAVSVTNLATNLLDLQVANLAVTPASPQSGGNVTVNWNDTLTGNIATPAGFYDNVTVLNVTTGQTLVNSNIFYDPSATGNGVIQPGQQRARQYAFTLPNGAAGAGQLQITVTTNATNSISEANSSGTARTNNSGSVAVNSTLAPAPDLQVANLALQPAAGLQSGTNLVTVSWSDSNTGNAAVGGSFYDTITITNLTTNTTLTSTGNFLRQSMPPATAPSPRVTRSVPDSFPTGCPTA